MRKIEQIKEFYVKKKKISLFLTLLSHDSNNLREIMRKIEKIKEFFHVMGKKKECNIF